MESFEASDRLQVCVGIWVKAGCVLLAKRPPHKHLGGLWEFPGGKIELGEASFDALVREYQEEVGVQVHTAHFWRYLDYETDTRGAIRLHLWRIEQATGEPYGAEGQEVRWVALEDLPTYDTPKVNAPILEDLLS